MPYINLSKSGRFDGPWTHESKPLDGQTRHDLTKDEYAAWNSIAGNPDPTGLGRYYFFDAKRPDPFYFGTLDQCANAAETPQEALAYVFSKASTEKRALARVRFSGLIEMPDSNDAPDIKGMIEAVDVSDDAELSALKDEMLKLSQLG